MTETLSKTKKNWLLFSLMIGPLLFYLFIIKSSAQFRFLPVLNKNIEDISQYNSDSVAFKNNISVVLFLGQDLLHKKTNALNLNEKIYKRFFKFDNFQFVVILPKGTKNKAEKLKKELSFNTDVSKWKFVYLEPSDIKKIFYSFNTNFIIDKNLYVKEAFIVDKNAFLRGRNNDEDSDNGILYGYNAERVSIIHKKMVDDVKVLLAEYRLALKKNKKKESFKNPYKK
jgi:hypothetical protein